MCAGVSLDDVLKLVQVLFYLATPIIAVYGLRSWRSELRGGAEYKVATDVLAGAYRIRDAIKHVQTPLMTPGEWASREKKESETEPQTVVYNSFYAFNHRFEVVREAVTDWYPHVIRAEALFGTEAKKALEALAVVKNKLWVAIEMWHQHEIKSRSEYQTHDSLYNIMYGLDPSEHPEESLKDNGFHVEFRAAMSKIEQIFKPLVERGKRRT